MIFLLLQNRGGTTIKEDIFVVTILLKIVLQPLDLNNARFPWQDNGRERGLRGIAFDGDNMYCMSSDTLYAFNSAFEFQESWTNPYLRHCRGIAIVERKLFIVSSGFDSVIGFDLESKAFDWALQVKSRGFDIGAHPFDPMSDDGPIMLAKLDLREIYCDGTGMYITSDKGVLRFNGNSIGIAIELPPGSHDARPYRDGVLFNDSEDGTIRYAGRGEGEEDRSMEVGDFSRGLCLLNDTIVASGSSPAAVSVYDLAANKKLFTVQINENEHSAIHTIAVWPFD